MTGECPICGKIVPHVPMDYDPLDELMKIEVQCPDCGNIRYTPQAINQMRSLTPNEKALIKQRADQLRPALKEHSDREVIVVSSLEPNVYADDRSFKICDVVPRMAPRHPENFQD